jgi:uncharacterized membrane protein YfcA
MAGIWTVYGPRLSAPAALHQIFGAFSLLLGVGILATLLLLKQDFTRSRLTPVDLFMLVVIAYTGGMITAWLSVGVGELIALYLIMRRFEISMAIAAAVVISACSVWSALPQHVVLNSHADLSIVALAGAGAVIGGLCARKLVSFFSAAGLKAFFGIWLLVIGVLG